ncbi:lipoxygenase [Xylariomycetidae sp. FL2044]|nr:lipoxygenase [Xylariomycetidae sp. FL2044]
MSVATQNPANGIDPAQKLHEILNGGINHKVEEDPMLVWDKGVFLNELQKQGIVLRTGKDGTTDGRLAAKRGLQKGTYKGTQMALTEVYSLIEEAAASHFDSKGFEPVIPMERDLKQKQALYNWSDPSVDGYPPHLLTLPPDEVDGAPGKGHIFDMGELAFISSIAKVLSFIIPESISHEGTPYEGPTLAACEKYNREHPSPNTDIMGGENIGSKDDWYSDARFAQQHFSGVNPTTIEAATPEKIKAYAEEAGKQGLEAMEKLLLSQNAELLMQDYSYFREATGVSDDQTFQNVVPELDGQGKPTGKFAVRYACAPVVIFQLHGDGRLHPLAITLDYRGGLDKSITLFNRRLGPDDDNDNNEGDDNIVDEKDDWPWRYAKTCAQTADWARHEIAVHLVDTHMVEEAVIVAANRTIPDDHLLYEVLSPHWFRTLALNAAARAVLVPAVIARLAGFGPTVAPDPKTNRAFALVDHAYRKFDFVGKYVPNDLKKRGFDLEAADCCGDKYRNYPYATDMYLLWGVIRQFVQSVLGTKYKTDADVRADPCIRAWCAELQTHGRMPSFPTIASVESLVDAVTMCIHTASPQHTAVNYLQDYYYSFVPARPPALCAPLPGSLAALRAYTEADLTAALPIGGTDDGSNPKWKDWLLAAQLPELLSFKVESRYNLITYAKSLYNVNKDRTVTENASFDAEAIREAAARFYSQLKDLELAFEYVSACQTEGSIEYKVLQPELTAVSILI